MWLRVRDRLRANRYRLAVEAARDYPGVRKLAGSPLLTRSEWVPDRPVGLTELPITWVPTSPATPLPPGPVPAGRASYSAAMAALDAPAVFENRPTYRLLAASLREPRLEFGPGRYFDGIDTGEAAAHEYAAGGPTPLRDAIGDPTDLARRPANLAVSALTIRVGARRTFLLHWRDPAKVGHAGGLYQVAPVGVFQASGPSQADFSLWRLLVREYAEELLGEPERTVVDYARWPFARTMTAALRAGRIRANCLGLGVDPLTFATDLLVTVEIDAPVFDALLGARVAVNAEGTMTEHPLTPTATADLPLQPAATALINHTLHP